MGLAVERPQTYTSGKVLDDINTFRIMDLYKVGVLFKVQSVLCDFKLNTPSVVCSVLNTNSRFNYFNIIAEFYVDIFRIIF